jgi:hypothetical protein
MLYNLPELWQTFFLEPSQINGLNVWCIVFMARDKSQLLVSLANPFTEESEEVFIEIVSDHDIGIFVKHYKQHFLGQLPGRFGFFRPDVRRVLTEYPDWQTFYDSWLNDDAKLLQGNMPLLFDYPSEQEYRAMQLKDADYAGYRRLMIVIYQYRKQQFQKVFIKSMDDVLYTQIKQQIDGLYGNAISDLIVPIATI